MPIDVFNGDDHRKTIHYPNGGSRDFQFDERDELVAVKQPSGVLWSKVAADVWKSSRDEKFEGSISLSKDGDYVYTGKDKSRRVIRADGEKYEEKEAIGSDDLPRLFRDLLPKLDSNKDGALSMDELKSKTALDRTNNDEEAAVVALRENFSKLKGLSNDQRWFDDKITSDDIKEFAKYNASFHKIDRIAHSRAVVHRNFEQLDSNHDGLLYGAELQEAIDKKTVPNLDLDAIRQVKSELAQIPKWYLVSKLRGRAAVEERDLEEGIIKIRHSNDFRIAFDVDWSMKSSHNDVRKLMYGSDPKERWKKDPLSEPTHPNVLTRKEFLSPGEIAGWTIGGAALAAALKFSDPATQCLVMGTFGLGYGFGLGFRVTDGFDNGDYIRSTRGGLSRQFDHQLLRRKEGEGWQLADKKTAKN
jgi:hypothetical protein